MTDFVDILLLVVLPLAWGLGVEFALEWLRRRRARASEPERAARHG